MTWSQRPLDNWHPEQISAEAIRKLFSEAQANIATKKKNNHAEKLARRSLGNSGAGSARLPSAITDDVGKDTDQAALVPAAAVRALPQDRGVAQALSVKASSPKGSLVADALSGTCTKSRRSQL